MTGNRSNSVAYLAAEIPAPEWSQRRGPRALDLGQANRQKDHLTALQAPRRPYAPAWNTASTAKGRATRGRQQSGGREQLRPGYGWRIRSEGNRWMLFMSA
jgi:hypothetical protein